MRNPLRRLVRSLGHRMAGPEIASLTARIDRLEAALEQSKAKNQQLAQQLAEQREKTRELYAKTKDYAARLNARQ